MLKQTIISIILIFGISSYSTQTVLAAEKPARNTNTSSPEISQPTRLQVSLSRRRLTVYRGNRSIKSYPIAIGRSGWETPTGNFQVIQMLENPDWIHPLTNQVIPAGNPQNPLGHYWIGFWTNGTNWVGFHGTPNPNSVGKAASHGCIRMYNKDIEELFSQVNLGTTVTVVP